MAATGYVAQLLNALDADTRTVLTTIFEYVMRENALGANTKAENFSWFKVEGTTHTTAFAEFSVSHGMDHIPSKLIPILALDDINAQIVPLQVSRAADARRIYLRSSSTGAAFTVYCE